MHAGSAGPVGDPVAGGGGGGGGGAYGPPWQTGLVGWLMHRGSSGPVGGPDGWSGTGAMDEPPKAGIANAGPAAPVAATTMSAPARAPLATMLPTREALVQLIFRSFALRKGDARPNVIDAEANSPTSTCADGWNIRTLAHRMRADSKSAKPTVHVAERHRERARIRMGPRHCASGSITSPRCMISTSPALARSRAMSRASAIKSRQSSPPTARAASDGQMVLAGARSRASVRIASRNRFSLTDRKKPVHPALETISATRSNLKA